MTFFLSDTNEYKEITVREWNGSGYGPDCFGDLETNFPIIHKMDEGSDAYICTASEYDDLVEFWVEEIRCMNDGEQGVCCDYSECPNTDICIFAD